MATQILLVNADAYSALLLQVRLRTIDCSAVLSFTGTDGLHLATSRTFDLIILDLDLPGLPGLELCRLLRACHIATPILIFTRQDTEQHKVAALDCGADDYVTRSCGTPELLARIRARLRGAAAQAPPTAETAAPTCLVLRDLQLDTLRHRVTVRGQAVDLTAKEFALLALLLRNPGRTYTRAELLAQVWGYSHDGYGHTVNSHINRLRLKIERDAAQPEYVLTVWSVGYRLRDN